MLQRVLTPFIDVPGGDGHGNAVDLLFRLFDIQTDAVLDLMGRPFRILEFCELIFIVGHAVDAAVEFLLFIQKGIDGLLPLRGSD